MRNNEDRMGAEFNQDAPIEQVVNPPTQTEQPRQQLSFVVPTELVDLPSQGLAYPEGHPLHGISSVEIRHMTAKEEDTLTSRTLLKKGVAIDKMLNDIIMNKNIKVENMIIGDKNALVVAARITGYGPEYRTKVVCPSCEKTQEFEFDLLQQKVNGPLNKEELEEANIKLTSINTYVISLWKGTAEVELKLLTGRDEAVLFEKMQKAQKNTGAAEAALTDQLRLMIRSVNGSTDVGVINQFVNSLPISESRRLRTIYKKITPSVELINTFACNFCDFETDMEVPFSQDFFWPK
ncbi:MAG: hypothetical protein RIR47_1020 [Bacteroidota bacterium]|jgi:hypothetical protein